MGVNMKLATALIRWASHHPRFGRAADYYTAGFVKPASDQCSPATMREYKDGDSFFRFFGDKLKVRELAGTDVLDLGCGYGGRTAYYFLQGAPRSICGLETTEAKVRIATESVRKLCGDAPISFQVAVGEALPYRDESFDLILSYDVFEHVESLPAVLSECYRVLRRGGRLCALFPPYYGPRSHHLDFITSFPFLHHIFSPRVLVAATNQLLSERPEIGVKPLPAPHRSYLGREVLPNLNGTTVRDFYTVVERVPFEQKTIELLPFAWGPGGAAKRAVRALCEVMLKLPGPLARDNFVSTICCVLHK